ncbi:MAG: DUF2752 domain-containing protein [Limisphaerales bacterium]
MLLVLGILYAFPPGDYGFYPQCGLHAWTGLHCPGCGSLRAVHHLTHGRVLAAAGSNALLVFGLGAFAGVLVAARHRCRTGRRCAGVDGGGASVSVELEADGCVWVVLWR